MLILNAFCNHVDLILTSFGLQIELKKRLGDQDGAGKLPDLKIMIFGHNQYTQRKPLYFENTGSASSSKIGHDFRKFEKNVVLQKKSSKLIFLNDLFF